MKAEWETRNMYEKKPNSDEIEGKLTSITPDGSYLFDSAKMSLSSKNGEIIPLRDQSFKVLELLVHHKNKIVKRNDLIEAVWGSRHVTDDSLVQCISEIRKAIGD